MISTALHAHLTEAASTPFDYRVNDCCTFAADWVVSRGHCDPMQRWRGRYANEGSASALIAEYGMLDMWTLGMIDAGIPEADEPKIGDVAVVECVSHDGVNQVGAIYGGKRWHVLGDKGLYQAHMKPLRIWRVGDALRDACRG
jgi:hypothetical protein